MEYYQFERIIKSVKKEFNVQDVSDDSNADFVIFALELNFYRIHQKYPEISSRRVSEAILLALHRISSYFTGKNPGTEKFENHDNLMFAEAILYTVDPRVNDVLMQEIKEYGFNLENRNDQIIVYSSTVALLLKLYNSVNTNLKMRGSNGYLTFLEDFLPQIPYTSSISDGEVFEYALYMRGDAALRENSAILKDDKSFIMISTIKHMNVTG